MEQNYITRPMALTQAQAAMSNTSQNPNIFEAYRPYRTPSAIIPGVKSVVTEDRGKNIIISMDGQDVRRKINIVWISIGVFFSLVMFYVAYAALADLPPFSQRGPSGGIYVPRSISIQDPSGVKMETMVQEFTPMVEDQELATVSSQPSVLHAPAVFVVKGSEDQLSSAALTEYSYGIMKVHDETLEPLDDGFTSWSLKKDLKEGDKVKITLYPKNNPFTAAILRKNHETDDVTVLATISLSPNIPRILYDDI